MPLITPRCLLLLSFASAGLAPAQDVAHRLIYSRYTAPTGAVWLNDGQGTDSLYFTNGNLARVDRSGRFVFYMQNTPVANAAYGGSWVRRDVADGSDHVLFNNNGDYVVGYDLLESDSAVVMSYSCAIYRYSFDATTSSVITSQSCFDDGPSLRQSDSLIVFHNTLTSMSTMKMDGSERAAIPNTTSHDVWPVFSPDGQWILFGRLNDDNTKYRNFYKIHPDGSGLTALTPYDPTDTAHFSSNAVWSEDGLAIICAGPRNGQNGLIAYAADGSFAHMPIHTEAGDDIAFISGAVNVVIVDGIAEEADSPVLKCWPTPADDHVDLQWDQQGPGEVHVFDAQGRLLLTRGTTGNTIRLDLSSLAPGVYPVILTARNGNWRRYANVVVR